MPLTNQFYYLALSLLFGKGFANILAGCTIEAKLGFPDWADPNNAPYYGDHTDWLEVLHQGEYCDAENVQPWCTYKNSNDESGSQGAYISNINDDWGPDALQEESITVDSMQGKTIKINVYHWYNPRDYYPDVDGWKDHMLAATLSITDKFKGIPVVDIFGDDGWAHPVKTETTTHVADYETNHDYEGEFGIFVTCDKYCDCIAHDYSTITDTDENDAEEVDPETPTNTSPRTSTGSIIAIAFMGLILFLVPTVFYATKEFKKKKNVAPTAGNSEMPIADEFSEKLDEFEQLYDLGESHSSVKAARNIKHEDVESLASSTKNFGNIDAFSNEEQSDMVSLSESSKSASENNDNDGTSSHLAQSVVESHMSVDAVGEIQDIDEFSHQFEGDQPGSNFDVIDL